jgi:hypothetical protein
MSVKWELNERSREERFDQVFQMVLIVVALSFDILWSAGRIPIAEIAVFIFALTIWAYGNLKGGKIEYPYKIGSFNLFILLLTNFYSFAVFGDLAYLGLWELVISAIVLPMICIAITLCLVSYLKDLLDKEITNGILIGGTLGYMISMSLLIILR